jgi:hypothetical protein
VVDDFMTEWHYTHAYMQRLVSMKRHEPLKCSICNEIVTPTPRTGNWFLPQNLGINVDQSGFSAKQQQDLAVAFQQQIAVHIIEAISLPGQTPTGKEPPLHGIAILGGLLTGLDHFAMYFASSDVIPALLTLDRKCTAIHGQLEDVFDMLLRCAIEDNHLPAIATLEDEIVALGDSKAANHS